MSQSTFDDELFGEAASEVREDVEQHLDAAREELPAVEAVWESDADNTLGTLNALRSALDVGDAADHLRDAKKRFAMGERADAFEDADDLEAEIAALDSAVADVEAAREQVGELASTVPSLKGALEELQVDDEPEPAADDADAADDEPDATDGEADEADAEA